MGSQKLFRSEKNLGVAKMKKIVCLLLVCVFGLMLFAQPERDFLDVVYEIMMSPAVRATGAVILGIYAWNLITLKPPTIVVNLPWWGATHAVIGPVLVINKGYQRGE